MKIDELRAELKALNSEYAKIGGLPAEERGEFGRFAWVWFVLVLLAVISLIVIFMI